MTRALLTVVGNRPQFIKMGPVSQELRQRGHHETVVHTGQHHDASLSDIFFEELALPRPDIRLEVTGCTHGAMTAEMLEKLESLMLDAAPSGVLIYGDTNSTLAAALAAAKLQIPLAHVESGPRTGDMAQPEEINRIIADRLSSLRFCADRQSVENLAREGITEGVSLTGDILLDAFRQHMPRAQGRHEPGEFALLTLHRPKNADDPEALKKLVKLIEALPCRVLFPAHPRTLKRIAEAGLESAFATIPNLRMTGPLGYLDTIAALRDCRFVVSDSGGLQREAYFARKFCFSLFDATPWPEIVRAGWQRECGFLPQLDIARLAAAARTIALPAEYPPLFGDGHAAARIVDALEEHAFVIASEAKQSSQSAVGAV